MKEMIKNGNIMGEMIKKGKENLFLLLVALGYAVLFILKPQMGMDAVKNSGYYIKEMLMIMPVIFVLTALLDTWIPKQTIIKYLGKNSKLKGTVLSFVLGSISAGPIYAAFPFCVMLHKKGASIKNIVIILSSWAVIKVPMLLNEIKFLGVPFMAVRWVLTVLAIVAFSWITSKIVKDEDLVQAERASGKSSENALDHASESGICINQQACLGCSLCAKSCPEVFEMNNRKASVKKKYFTPEETKIRQAMESCPVKAITK